MADGYDQDLGVRKAPDQSPKLCLEIPKLLEGCNVVTYLQPYGFLADTAFNWRAPPPEVNITVSGHDASESHEFYHVECSLLHHYAGEHWRWCAAIRLKHLRKGLHDLVKMQLGSSYQTYFSRVPFAHHGRPAGTTARLDKWCRRLAYCINSKLVPPLVAAAVLRLTGVPEAPVPSHSASLRTDPEKRNRESFLPVAGPTNGLAVALDIRSSFSSGVSEPPNEMDRPTIVRSCDLLDARTVGTEVLNSPGQEELPESTCTGGTGPSDSDESNSCADVSDEEGAAQVGISLCNAPLDVAVESPQRSPLRKRMSERRKVVDTQAIGLDAPQ